MYTFHGDWKSGTNAGGCSDNLQKYATNPQYYMNIEPGKKLCREVCHNYLQCMPQSGNFFAMSIKL